MAIKSVMGGYYVEAIPHWDRRKHIRRCVSIRVVKGGEIVAWFDRYDHAKAFAKKMDKSDARERT